MVLGIVGVHKSNDTLAFPFFCYSLIRFSCLLVPANAMPILAFPAFPCSFIMDVAILGPWPGLGIRALGPAWALPLPRPRPALGLGP